MESPDTVNINTEGFARSKLSSSETLFSIESSATVAKPALTDEVKRIAPKHSGLIKNFPFFSLIRSVSLSF